MGPLISAGQLARVRGYVDGARAEVLHQGTAPDGPGYWHPATLLGTADPAAAHWREEIFGPVLSVLPFDSEEQAVRLANDSPYGLSASIWTSNLSRGLRLARSVEAGVLSVNSHSSVRYWTPFGGVKQSGLGRELGPDAPLAFTETKNVFFAVEP
jgi:acyl-CoA reductase-like NAD-dependent aldehyde dehydrogenase